MLSAARLSELGAPSCITIQRGAKLGSVLPQPLVCLGDGIWMMWNELSVSIGNHSQHFGNGFGLAIPAR